MSDGDLTTNFSVPNIQPIPRRRLGRTTVVGQKELINAPLQRSEERNDPLARMTGTIEVSATHLLQNILGSEHYALTLQLKNKFWMDQNVVNGSEEFNELDEVNVDLPVVNWIPSVDDVVRKKLCGYQVSNSACDNFQYSEAFTTLITNQPDVGDNHRTDEMELDLHFDLDANPVALNDSEPPMPPIVVSFNGDDQNPNTSAVDDLRPLSTTPLSYSYSRLTDVQLVTSAENHWRLPSIIQPNSSERQSTSRRRCRKVAKKDKPVLVTRVLSDSVEQKFMSVDDQRTRSIWKGHQAAWQSTKLTMPSRMGYSSALKFLPLMLGQVSDEQSIETNVVVDTALVSNIDSNLADDADDVGMEMDMDPVITTHSSSPNVTQLTIEVAPNVTPLTIEWTPNVDDYAIVPPMPQTPFQITPANVNVEAITRRCLEVICALEAAGGERTFGRVYAQLQTDGQSTTPALIFSAILELANRNNFRLEKIADVNDIVIKRL